MIDYINAALKAVDGLLGYAKEKKLEDYGKKKVEVASLKNLVEEFEHGADVKRRAKQQLIDGGIPEDDQFRRGR